MYFLYISAGIGQKPFFCWNVSHLAQSLSQCRCSGCLASRWLARIFVALSVIFLKSRSKYGCPYSLGRVPFVVLRPIVGNPCNNRVSRVANVFLQLIFVAWWLFVLGFPPLTQSIFVGNLRKGKNENFEKWYISIYRGKWISEYPPRPI